MLFFNINFEVDSMRNKIFCIKKTIVRLNINIIYVYINGIVVLK